MKINSQNSIDFRAKFLCNTEIKKFNHKTNVYSPLKVSFLEYEPDNLKDLITITETATSWKKQQYAKKIALNAKLISVGFLSNLKNHIYILTKQKESFDKLNSQDILGLAHMLNEENPIPDELVLFEVKPDFRYEKNKKKEYKNIGKSIIDLLKNIYCNSIKVFSSYTAANFYEKQGFEIIDTNVLEYLWKNKK